MSPLVSGAGTTFPGSKLPLHPLVMAAQAVVTAGLTLLLATDLPAHLSPLVPGAPQPLVFLTAGVFLHLLLALPIGLRPVTTRGEMARTALAEGLLTLGLLGLGLALAGRVVPVAWEPTAPAAALIGSFAAFVTMLHMAGPRWANLILAPLALLGPLMAFLLDEFVRARTGQSLPLPVWAEVSPFVAIQRVASGTQGVWPIALYSIGALAALASGPAAREVGSAQSESQADR